MDGRRRTILANVILSGAKNLEARLERQILRFAQDDGLHACLDSLYAMRRSCGAASIAGRGEVNSRRQARNIMG